MMTSPSTTKRQVNLVPIYERLASAIREAIRQADINVFNLSCAHRRATNSATRSDLKDLLDGAKKIREALNIAYNGVQIELAFPPLLSYDD